MSKKVRKSADLTQRLPPLETNGFVVIVTPVEDLTTPRPTIPVLADQRYARGLAIAAMTGVDGTVSASPWAFTNKSRKATAKKLRDLANWLEEMAIPDP